MSKEKLKTASVLAFERKLANSDGLMHGGRWEERAKADGWKPIKIQEKAVRGTISNRLKNAIQSDPLKLDAEIQKPNLQRVDVAALPFEADTLKVSFTLRILGNLSEPSACNNPEYQQALAAVIEQYTAVHGFAELSRRYAVNIANGRFLWRNRIGAEEIEIYVTSEGSKWIYNSEDYDLRTFPEATGDFGELSEAINRGLAGTAYTFLTVEAFVKLGAGQEVFPSQELVVDREDSEKSKTLYQVDGVAALHSQKIGNALRTIDSWHTEADAIGPIAVEPYGSVTNRGKAYRQPKEKEDFYTLLDNWILKEQAPKVEQQHYVMATLIRGGVFGESGKGD